MFRDIANYEGLYEINNTGVVYSKCRFVAHPVCGQKTIRRKRLAQVLNNGRKRVTLYKDGVAKRFLVHRLVMQTFVGDCPDGMEVCHNDGDPSNNAVSNLRYDTRVNNAADSELHGTRLTGAKNHKTKLTPENVVRIRELSEFQTQERLALAFGVSQGAISRVLLRKTWRHV